MLRFAFIALICSVLIYRLPWFKIKGLNSGWTVLAFALKCLTGFAVLWLYANQIDIERHKADVFKYFDDAITLDEIREEVPDVYSALMWGAITPEHHDYEDRMRSWASTSHHYWYNDHRTMIRLHNIMLNLSAGDIRIHVVLFNLLSILGLVLLFKGLDYIGRFPPWLFIVACILPPSLLLWSSALLKECLVMLPLGMIVYGACRWREGWLEKLTLLLGVIVIAFLKPFVGLCLIPALLFLIFSGRAGVSKGLAYTAISLILLLGSTLLNPHTDFVEVLSDRQASFVALAEAEEAGSAIAIHTFSDLKGFVLQAPQAVLNVLCRPHVGEIRASLDALAALENLIYALLFVLVLFKARAWWKDRLFVFAMLYVLAMALLIGSVTPILGAVVRYKAPMLPFLIIALYQLLRSSPFSRFIPEHHEKQ